MTKKTIGIIGGGQLGRMLTLAAIPMGYDVVVLDKTKNCPASQVGAKQIVADITDENGLKELYKTSDIVTFEIEHINSNFLKKISINNNKIQPDVNTLEVIKDKLEQKKFLKKYNIPTAEFLEIKNKNDLDVIVKKFRLPFVIKTKNGGYDGRGNYTIKNINDLENIKKILYMENLYAEKFVEFHKEIAVICARSISGEIKLYPVIQTIQERNICQFAIAPADISREEAELAKKTALKTIEKLNGLGVFCIEMFLLKNKKILINEIAPRVHNSGHLTIEACETSQFEQHIRSITGMPLGRTTMFYKKAVMINILGKKNHNTNLLDLYKTENNLETHIHWYGKKPTKIDRKMGHITLLGENEKDLYNKAVKIKDSIDV